MKAANIQLCKPVTKKHRAGVQWYANLMAVLEQHELNGPQKSNLRRSMEFYSIYAETADERYLGLCEDFLRDCIAAD